MVERMPRRQAEPRAGVGSVAEPTRIGVQAISVDFGTTRALADVTLDVPRGRVTAVVGGDGAGKSTLLRVFANRIRPGTGTVDTLPRESIGYQPATSGVWGNLTVAENVEFVGRSYGMGARDIRTRGDALLDRAALSEARDRLGRDLSGGMRQKLGFVLAMLHDPELVLLDEPSTGVDPVSRVELWRLISAIAAGDTAVLMATTYLDEAERAASVIALDRGRVIADGDPERIVAGLPGTIGLLPDDGLGDPERVEDSWRRGIRRHVWIPEGASAGDATPIARPDLEDALIALTLAARGTDGPPESGVATSPESRAGLAGTVADGPFARASHVTRRFGRHLAVDDVSLEVHPGEILGLIGANGAGKTTLLRMLIGLEPPDAGQVELFGAPPDDRSRRRLGYVPQGLGLFRTITVAQNAEFVARVYGLGRIELPPSLTAISNDVVADIGLGRQRQLAFALALAHRPDLLVLDEPTSGVDPLARARLWDLVHGQAAAGRGVIVTTHYLQEAEQCTRLALMSHGRLLGVGSVGDLTAGTTAVLVRSDAWQQAFTALGDAGLPTMLTGRDVRVAGVPADDVRGVLARAGVAASVTPVAPTLEETMVLLDQPHPEPAAASAADTSGADGSAA